MVNKLGIKFNISFPPKVSLEQYIEIKRNELLSFQEKHRLNITNSDVEKDKTIFTNPKISFRYSYARFDSYINYSDFLTDFYYINNKKYKTKLFFTNSGMSAITSLLMALKQICKDYQFLDGKRHSWHSLRCHSAYWKRN